MTRANPRQIDAIKLKQVLEHTLTNKTFDLIDDAVLEQLQALITKRIKRREYSKVNQRLNRMRKRNRDANDKIPQAITDALNQNEADLVRQVEKPSSSSLSKGEDLDQRIQQALKIARQDQTHRQLQWWMIEQLYEFVLVLFRRQQSCKIYQHAHKGRTQAEEKRLLEVNQSLKNKIEEQQRKREILQLCLANVVTDRRVSQVKIMDIYAQLFRQGTTLLNMASQATFFGIFFESDFKYCGGSVPLNREELLEQWKLTSRLFPGLLAKIKSINAVSECMVQVELDMELPIKRKAIELLYPHIIADEYLVQEVITKKLRHPILLNVWFSPGTKVELMETEYDLTSSWARVLDDAAKAVRVMAEGKLVNGQIHLGKDMQKQLTAATENAQ